MQADTAYYNAHYTDRYLSDTTECVIVYKSAELSHCKHRRMQCYLHSCCPFEGLLAGSAVSDIVAGAAVLLLLRTYCRG
jgi:hypothetical protein